MDKPTTEELRADTRVPWADFGLPVPTPPATDDLLQDEIDFAWAFVESVTGRDLDTLDDPGLVALAKRALKLAITYNAIANRGEYGSLTAGGDGIQSFSVPGYSETRFGPGSSTTIERNSYYAVPWDPLDRILWLLMTDEMRDYWERLRLGKSPVFFGVVHEEEHPALFGIERPDFFGGVLW